MIEAFHDQTKISFVCLGQTRAIVFEIEEVARIDEIIKNG